MNISAAINYAILMVNDQENKDYYDNFVPMIAECIRRSTSPYISANEVQYDLSKQFGIKIPINVIDTILRRRLTSKKYIQYKDKKFIPNREMLESLNFVSKQESILEQHEKLINQLISFSKKYPTINWTKEDAENAFDHYLKRNNLLLLNIEKSSVTNTEEYNGSPAFIIGQYIKSLDIDSIEYRYFESIVKGDMLANAIYFTDPAHTGMKFQNNTQIYFDTTFLIYALGYAGEARQAPCLELISLLKDSNAVLRCFKHTINEIIGILEGCQYRLRTGNLVDNHGTMEYFLANKYTATDIDRLIYSVENEIEQRLKIRVFEKPSYIEEFNIDERGLTETLRGSIRYTKEQALERDVTSIAAIMRLRKLQSSIYIENCKALFITTNHSLAEITKRYFFKESDNNRIIPPVLPAYILTNLLWLKNPTASPTLTRKRIIADCVASTATPEYIWKRYFEKIEEIKNNGTITSDDYYILRYSQEARSLMMEITSGDENAITIGTIEEILAASKAELIKDQQSITEETQRKKDEVQAEFESYIREVASATEIRNDRINNISISWGRRIVKIIKAVIVLILLAGQTFAYYMLNFTIPLWVHIPVVLLFISFFPVAGYMGLSLLRPFDKLEHFIVNLIKNKLTSLVDLRQQTT
ncbi:hypothetical protein MUG84_16740 [Paenibacillus sp. KQZ6P-2]|uniref:Uncharacterized protein n=1 Tax=Paenibacillus mangrovi TaxID=2931978 RepID=A0A9X1WTM5_9BACL|nr:hypothetical protein [Paenibacillus mangrovi]MCJ8013378.1 hypothetical protein [Paenibacillus mangrovi]